MGRTNNNGEHFGSVFQVGGGVENDDGGTSGNDALGGGIALAESDSPIPAPADSGKDSHSGALDGGVDSGAAPDGGNLGFGGAAFGDGNGVDGSNGSANSTD